jgi:hypothetical protein
MQEGTQTFLKFITTTYQELVKKEEIMNMETSGLRIFCRLDVAVMDDAGELCYFVSGLERSFGTHLAASFTASAPTFAVSMSDALGAYILTRSK